MPAGLAAWPAYAAVEAPGYSFTVGPPAKENPLPGGKWAQARQGYIRHVRRDFTCLMPADRVADFREFADGADRPPWFAWREPWNIERPRGRSLVWPARFLGEVSLSPSGLRGAATWAARCVAEGPAPNGGLQNPSGYIPPTTYMPDYPVRRVSEVRIELPQSRLQFEDGAVEARRIYAASRVTRDVVLYAEPRPGITDDLSVRRWITWCEAVDLGAFTMRARAEGGGEYQARIVGGLAGVRFTQTNARGAPEWEIRFRIIEA